ncbi:hypothetical protein PLEOSDRAFT_1072033, partial [Pleurotus ostreatus PC15]
MDTTAMDRSVYFRDVQVHSNPDCPVNIQRQFQALLLHAPTGADGKESDSEGAFPQPSRALRCETCNEVRKRHKHNIPSIWYPGAEPRLPVSSELVLLYCGLTAFRQLQRKLDDETAKLC